MCPHIGKDAGVDRCRLAVFNPLVFQQTVTGSTDYDQALHDLAGGPGAVDKRAEAIREALVLDDVRRAADLLRPVYNQTGGAEGYVSLGINPNLAHDVDGMVLEARRLFTEAGRTNVMIALPGTPAGLASAQALLGDGIGVVARRSAGDSLSSGGGRRR